MYQINKAYEEFCAK